MRWPLDQFFVFFVLGCVVAACGDGGGGEGDASHETGAEGDDGAYERVDADPGADSDAGEDDEADTSAADAPDDSDPCADHCSNGVLDCGETDMDCGGDCAPCGAVVLAGNGTLPNVAWAATGEVMVVWTDLDTTDIHYMLNDGPLWSAAAPVAATYEVSEFPRLAVDSMGRFHLVFMEGMGDGRKIMYAMHRDSSWTDLERLDVEDYPPVTPEPNLNSCWPSIDVDDAGNPWVVWTEDDYYIIHFTRKVGGAWTPPIKIDPLDPDPPVNSMHPDIAVAGYRACIVWMEDFTASKRLLFVEGDGTNWSGPINLADAGGYHKWPQIEADIAGDVYLLATDKHAPGSQVRFRGRIGGVWTDPWLGLSTAETDETWSSIALGPAETLHAVWAEQDEAGIRQVRYAVGDAVTGAWQEGRPVTAGADAADVPAVAVDAGGFAHVVWTDGRILYAKVRFADL